ncbi:pilus assembly protein TadG-related protein [Sporosarcina soli]|uniref:Pilus assembly protein TadG-related protein n=1 Tax=Sporosarcina soli TaxID=334736 RepID=A0ABW0TIU5_9BACL
MRQMNGFRKIIQNERGDGLMLVMVGILLTSVFICFVFFDFSNVFINKRVTQTGADAAALAGAKSSSEYMSEILQEKVEEELEDVTRSWEAYLAAALDEEKSIAELFDEFIESVENSRGKSMPGDIRNYIWSGSGQVEGNPALRFFFKDNEISVMACKAVRDNLPSSYREATAFAEENQNDRLVDYQFLEDEFKIYAKTERNGQYITVPDSSVKAISAQASIQIGSPKDVQIACP